MSAVVKWRHAGAVDFLGGVVAFVGSLVDRLPSSLCAYGRMPRVVSPCTKEVEVDARSSEEKKKS